MSTILKLTGPMLPSVGKPYFSINAKKVANTNMMYAYSQEYKIMYDAIKATEDKIDIKNSEYLVEKLKESSYIEYMDYSNWNTLIKKIVTI